MLPAPETFLLRNYLLLHLSCAPEAIRGRIGASAPMRRAKFMPRRCGTALSTSTRFASAVAHEDERQLSDLLKTSADHVVGLMRQTNETVRQFQEVFNQVVRQQTTQLTEQMRASADEIKQRTQEVQQLVRDARSRQLSSSAVRRSRACRAVAVRTSVHAAGSPRDRLD